MTLRPVLQGEEVAQQARGSFGVVRRKAAVDGLAWETADECGFIPEADLQRAVVELRMKKRKAGR